MSLAIDVPTVQGHDRTDVHWIRGESSCLRCYLWCGFVAACGGALGFVIKAVANQNAQFKRGWASLSKSPLRRAGGTPYQRVCNSGQVKGLSYPLVNCEFGMQISSTGFAQLVRTKFSTQSIATSRLSMIAADRSPV